MTERWPYEKTEKTPVGDRIFKKIFLYIFLLVVSKYGGIPKISFLGPPELGE